MKEKYIATIYEKIYTTDNVLMLRRVGVIEDGDIDLDDDMEQLTYYENSGKRVILDPMNSAYTFVSDDRYCYGFPATIEDLKNFYSDKLSDEELVERYTDDLEGTVCLLYYNELEDTVKLIVTNEEIFKSLEIDDEELFNSFSIYYDSTNDKNISLPLGDVKKLIKYAKNNNNKKLKEALLKLDNNLNYSEKTIEQFLTMSLEETDKKKKKDKDNTSIEESLQELNELVGLENIKQEINKLVDYLVYLDKTKKYLKLENPNLHMIFTGNPGTGKTTVARIVGNILYELGYAKNNNFIEITPKDLIAGYVGQTAIKTAELLEKNRGGIIFIDEAYAFASRAQDFAPEALAEILKELEKKETIFIFAGYEKEMRDFIEMNSGLTSRIGFYLDYKDYSCEELYQIFESKISKMGFVVTDELKEKLKIKIAQSKNQKNFGNGRYIDKLIDKLILEHSTNTKKYKRKDKLITLTDKDYTEDLEETLQYKVKKRKIGF